MSKDITSRPSTEDLTPPAPAAFLPCSDCRAPMQKHYYALDTRPVCPKCRTGYQKRVDYAKGPGSLARVFRMAGGTALAGVAALSAIGWAVPVFRVIPAVGLAWFIAKAVNKASGDYFLRRNQVVGAILLYLAIGLAGSIPATINAFSGPSRAEREAKIITVEEAEDALEALASHESTTEEAEKAEETIKKATREQRPESLNESAGGQLQRAGIVAGVLVFVIITLAMPFLSIFGAGLYGAGFALFALGGAFWKFKEWTSDGVSYDVSGPFRVGTGPIPTTW
jgi:hypothetical protein